MNDAARHRETILCASSVTVFLIYSSHQKNESNHSVINHTDTDRDKEAMIMQNTMNYRGITRYSYDTTRPTALAAIFRRMISFIKAAMATKKANEHGLSNAMEARLYL